MQAVLTAAQSAASAAAAAAAACPLQKLVSVTTSADAAQVDIDLSAVDLTQYHELQIYFEGTAASYGPYLFLRVNGTTEYHYAQIDGSTVYNSTMTYLMNGTISPIISGVSVVSMRVGLDGYVSGLTSSYRYYGCNYSSGGGTNAYFSKEQDFSNYHYVWTSGASAIQTLNFVTQTYSASNPRSGLIGAGSKIQIYGVKR